MAGPLTERLKCSVNTTTGLPSGRANQTKASTTPGTKLSQRLAVNGSASSGRRRAASGSYQRVYDARGRKPGGGILEFAGEMDPSFRLRESCSRTSLEMATVCEIDVRRPSGKHASTPFIRSRGRLRHRSEERRVGKEG